MESSSIIPITEFTSICWIDGNHSAIVIQQEFTGNASSPKALPCASACNDRALVPLCAVRGDQTGNPIPFEVMCLIGMPKGYLSGLVTAMQIQKGLWRSQSLRPKISPLPDSRHNWAV
ncbi:hypothetical protein [Kordiimonas sp.]|uniref:hypothetical protein n=1 Tax=Kordiimonas sp. TaxID=1970157 RepID=UPI003B52C151